jgi:anti-anti-sigma regulatory factor
MMHLTVMDSGTLGILTLRGNLSELHAGELRAYLARGIDRVNRLIVNCEKVASIDMICLKLLCTAYQVSRVMKKDFAFAGDRTALFRQAAGTDEYARRAGACQGCETGCLWTDNGPGRHSGNDTPESAPARSDEAA